MRLVPIPDGTGTPVIWVNPNHLVSLTPSYRPSMTGVRLDVEVKISGAQSFVHHLSEYPDRESAAAGFQEFIDKLQPRGATDH